jgi:hypothetical protein
LLPDDPGAPVEPAMRRAYVAVFIVSLVSLATEIV